MERKKQKIYLLKHLNLSLGIQDLLEFLYPELY